VLVVSLNDAAFRAVQAHGEGATASDVLDYLSREFGLAVRPNHLGLALQPPGALVEQIPGPVAQARRSFSHAAQCSPCLDLTIIE